MTGKKEALQAVWTYLALLVLLAMTPGCSHSVKNPSAFLDGSVEACFSKGPRPKNAPAAILTEAIASGMGGTGGERIGARGDEPRLTQEHGTVIADTPRPEVIEGSSVEENVDIDPGSADVLAPTHEQIARRAYELYLERGEKAGDE